MAIELRTRSYVSPVGTGGRSNFDWYQPWSFH